MTWTPERKAAIRAQFAPTRERRVSSLDKKIVAAAIQRYHEALFERDYLGGDPIHVADAENNLHALGVDPSKV